jgi:hypothetical protein
MKALSFVAFLLSLIGSGNALAIEDYGPFVVNKTMTCAAMIETMEFVGSCCSLADDPVTGNCVITINNGYCYWIERCASGFVCLCDGFGGHGWIIQYTQYSSLSDAPCPASTYNVSNTGCTKPPTTWADLDAECAAECAVPNVNITENESMEPTPAIPENESIGPTTTGIPENESMGPTAAPGASAGVHTLRPGGFAIMSTLFATFALSSINHRHV